MITEKMQGETLYLGDVVMHVENAELKLEYDHISRNPNSIISSLRKQRKISFKKSWINERCIYPNNYKRMHGLPATRWRKLIKLNPNRYALTSYEMLNEYMKKKYTFDQWRKKIRAE